MRENRYRLTLTLIIEGTDIDNALSRMNKRTGILALMDKKEEIQYEMIGKSRKKVFVMPIQDEEEN
jgi:hypothetical protein